MHHDLRSMDMKSVENARAPATRMLQRAAAAFCFQYPFLDGARRLARPSDRIFMQSAGQQGREARQGQFLVAVLTTRGLNRHAQDPVAVNAPAKALPDKHLVRV